MERKYKDGTSADIYMYTKIWDLQMLESQIAMEISIQNQKYLMQSADVQDLNATRGIENASKPK